MKIVVHGSTGRMGSIVCEKIAAREDMSLAARVSMDETPSATENRYISLGDYAGGADCVIDFTNHTATKALLDWCVARNCSVVVATTGHTEDEKAAIRDAAEKIPVFWSANMSIGVACVAEMGKKAATMFPDSDIEIVEMHHNQKLDVPSGTALMLAERIRDARPEAELVIGRHEYGKRRKNEIGIHSLRLGNEVGTHEIIISAGSETITIKHEAENRSLFADGAVAAAAFLAGKAAGLYSMKDILA